jgi:hypothetical protein
MCTVTYIPVKDGFYLASNRDEQLSRPAALEPGIYKGNTGALLFPKDTGAGGTWFAAHEKGHVAVLLNGAWRQHTPMAHYRRSRGLVLLDIVDQQDPLRAFHAAGLEGIEPFTLILAEEGRLHECRWDGATRSHTPQDPAHPHIWSSVTLYTPDVIRRREEWFDAWLKQHPHPTADDIFRFHCFRVEGDPGNSILMERAGRIHTVSITVLEHISSLPIKVRYLDLHAQKTFLRTFRTSANPSAV